MFNFEQLFLRGSKNRDILQKRCLNFLRIWGLFLRKKGKKKTWRGCFHRSIWRHKNPLNLSNNIFMTFTLNCNKIIEPAQGTKWWHVSKCSNGRKHWDDRIHKRCQITCVDFYLFDSITSCWVIIVYTPVGACWSTKDQTWPNPNQISHQVAR